MSGRTSLTTTLPRAICCDVDGVLFHHGRPLPGAERFFRWLAATSLPCALLTNHAEADPRRLSGLTAAAGHRIAPQHVVTSTGLAVAFLRREGIEQVALLGGPRLRAALQDAGLRVVAADEPAQAVLVGYLAGARSEELAEMASRLRAGTRFLATNADLLLPQGDGYGLETGAWLSLLTAVSGRSPEVIGKPSAFAFEHACRLLRVPPSQTVMIGDTLDTDIRGALAMGMTAWRVRSGNGRDDPEADRVAHRTFADIGEVVEVMGGGP